MARSAAIGMADHMTTPELVSEARREVRLLLVEVDDLKRKGKRALHLLDVAERDARQKGSAA